MERTRLLKSALMPTLVLLVAGRPGFGESPAFRLQFLDVTRESGIRFVHQNSPTPQKYLVETVGSGCAFLDFNRDGWLDIFLVNGGWTPGTTRDRLLDHALYKNQGDGTFRDVTSKSGIESNRFYGMGAAVGDYDNDGFDDLLVTHFGGPDLLYRNQGDGTFQNVTSKAGVGGDGRWSSSAAFLDFDNDGDLDLYVVGYLNHSFENNQMCGHGSIVPYCTPEVYQAVPDVLYRNNGDGTFTDVSRPAGIARPDGKGLGVIPTDFDQDGLVDLYVANDGVANFLFRNKGDGTFDEMGLLSSTAFDEHGEAQAGMGTVAGDFDGDGLIDIAVTNLDTEYLVLYRNTGDGLFEDVSSQAGLKLPTSPYVGFGVVSVDVDNDSDLDLFVANGNTMDNAAQIREGATYRQPNLLFENTGGRFRDISALSGQAVGRAAVSRGLAWADYDNDGDVDLLVVNEGESPLLLRNDGGNRNGWLQVQLEGTVSNRNGFGARVELKAGNRRILREVTSGGSYLSASDSRAHFGLGAYRGPLEMTVAWPSGTRDSIGNLRPGQRVVVKEGSTR